MVSLSGRGGRRDGPLLQAQRQEVGPGQETLSEEAARVNNPQPPPLRTHMLVHIECFFLKKYIYFFPHCTLTCLHTWRTRTYVKRKRAGEKHSTPFRRQMPDDSGGRCGRTGVRGMGGEGAGVLIHVRLFGLAATASSLHDFKTGNS